jgi:hypothetical protein
MSQNILLGTPLGEYPLDDSPVSEHRQCENRLAIRREFGSEVADLCARDDVFEAEGPHSEVVLARQTLIRRPISVLGVVIFGV